MRGARGMTAVSFEFSVGCKWGSEGSEGLRGDVDESMQGAVGSWGQ